MGQFQQIRLPCAMSCPRKSQRPHRQAPVDLLPERHVSGHTFPSSACLDAAQHGDHQSSELSNVNLWQCNPFLIYLASSWVYMSNRGVQARQKRHSGRVKSDLGPRKANTADMLWSRRASLSGSTGGWTPAQCCHMSGLHYIPNRPLELRASMQCRAYIGQYSHQGNLYVGQLSFNYPMDIKQSCQVSLRATAADVALQRCSCNSVSSLQAAGQINLCCRGKQGFP